MGSLTPPLDSIPIIDLSLFNHPSSRIEVSRSLVDACHTSGFVYLTNHGLSSDLISTAFSWSQKFFALSDEQKALAKHVDGSDIFRGWSGIGKEQLPELEGEKKKGVVDFNQSYALGIDGNDEQPNVWIPESVLPGFRSFILEFQNECWDVSQNVLRALAIGLGLKEEEFLLKLHALSENELSLRHYPPVDEQPIKTGELDRLGAHTDFDSFTLLWQDAVGGLEVKDKNGKWVDVKPFEGAIVMNIGDVLQRWSNDYLTSTIHRVHLPPLDDSFQGEDGKRKTIPRYSIPYFVVPRKHVMMTPLEGEFIQGNEKKYEPVRWGDYQAQKIKGIFQS